MGQAHTFPDQFIWGTATSSYQIEGAAFTDGKGPSIWDAFCQIPGKVANNDNGLIACDHYHRFEEDVQLMKQMGVPAYRFSISWPRLLPSGRGTVNKAGIAFYNRLIDTLLKHDIQPWVTLYHWDLPLALQLESDGWLGEQIPDDFAAYAELCFANFGDRVKNWITLNEPWVITILGHGQGIFAPGRTSMSDPYRSGHQLLRAHARAVAIYRDKYQHQQGGQIGITNNCDWREPLTDAPADQAAAQRALEFFLPWFTDPIYKGHYPESMVERVGKRLPEFTKTDIELLKGSTDFFGLNHYSTLYAADAGGKIESGNPYNNGGMAADQDVNLSADPNWSRSEMGWPIVGWGFRKLLEYIDERYDRPPIVITENGGAFPDQMIDGEVQDDDRIAYYREYLTAVHQAIEQGVDVRGYFAWSFMDNFEWASGYEKRFGLHYVNYETLQRTPKKSAHWFAEVIRRNGLPLPA